MHAGPAAGRRACAGLQVVELGSGMALAMAGMVLADNGASVAKVEPPGGAGERSSPGHRMWNRGKRSVVLDLRSAEGRLGVAELVARADVILTAFAPGAAARLGVDPARMAEVSPALVCAVITGMGPLESRQPVRGYDAIVSAIVGRMSEVDLLSGAVPGQDRRWPIFTAPPVLAYGAAQLAVQGVLAALLRRDRCGRGAVVRTSLLEAWTVFMMRHPLLRGQQPGDSDLPATMQRGLELCFLTARCSDGRFIQMCARQDSHFRAWMLALGLDRLLTEPAFAGMPLGVPSMAALDELEKLIRSRMQTRSQAEWMRVFTEDHDVGGDPFLTPEEFLDHPQMTANERVVLLDDPEVGPVRQPGVLAAMSATPGIPALPAPLLGGDTVASIRRQWREPPAEPDRRPRDDALPLAGVTVLEAAHFVAGPLAGSLLSELGARVIKLEPLGGDPFRRTGAQSIKFLLGKESIAVNLKDPRARSIVDALVARSDVFVHSFRPDVPDRLSLGYDRLAVINPRLVYLNASAYGSRGPQRNRAAFHSTPTALSGAGIVQAGAGNPPVDDSFPDPGGALAVATAVLLGLSARASTGAGQYIETTMLTSAGYVVSEDIVRFPGAPQVPVPDRRQLGRTALYRLYESADGWLFLAAPRAEDWEPLLVGLGSPSWAGREEFADASSRRTHDVTLSALLAGEFGQRQAREVVDMLCAQGVPAAVVTGSASPDWLLEQGLLSPGSHPAYGEFWRLPPRIRYDGQTSVAGPPAALGEHSRALLAELGFPPEVIAGLVDEGVVGVWDARPAGDR